MVVEMEHPTAGKLKTIGVPLKFSATQAQPAWTPPLMGEDTLAILREAGLTDEQIQALATQKVVQFGK
jgi:crotonobetainyl-CoA:carnitine CoA-transferase CaiB-like acyl-CoA transferase